MVEGATRRTLAPAARAGLVAVALAVALVAAACGSSGGDDAATTTTEPQLDVLAVGDSYSSGEGTVHSARTCGRSPDAYPELVAADLRGRNRLGDLVVQTCTGAELADVGAQLDAVGDRRFDLVTLTVGGNDAGYSSVLADCIGVDDALAIVLDDERLDSFSLRSCDVTADELTSRVDALGPELEDLYRTIVDRHLAPGGTLVVLGYPQLFEAPEAWAPGEGERCDGVDRADVTTLRQVGTELDRVVAEHVGAVPHAVFVDTSAAFTGHGRCSADPWLKGFTVRPRLRSSFHPDEQGHRAMADLVLQQVGG